MCVYTRIYKGMYVNTYTYIWIGDHMSMHLFLDNHSLYTREYICVCAYTFPYLSDHTTMSLSSWAIKYVCVYVCTYIAR